jgi:polyphosphate kinase
MMPRNLYRRVEILYPIENRNLQTRIIKEILFTYLRDNMKARTQQSDGSYARLRGLPGTKHIRSQSELIRIARKGGVKSAPYDELVKQIGRKKRSKLAKAIRKQE